METDLRLASWQRPESRYRSWFAEPDLVVDLSGRDEIGRWNSQVWTGWWWLECRWRGLQLAGVLGNSWRREKHQGSFSANLRWSVGRATVAGHESGGCSGFARLLELRNEGWFREEDGDWGGVAWKWEVARIYSRQSKGIQWQVSSDNPLYIVVWTLKTLPCSVCKYVLLRERESIDRDALPNGRWHSHLLISTSFIYFRRCYLRTTSDNSLVPSQRDWRCPHTVFPGSCSYWYSDWSRWLDERRLHTYP